MEMLRIPGRTFAEPNLNRGECQFPFWSRINLQDKKSCGQQIPSSMGLSGHFTSNQRSQGFGGMREHYIACWVFYRQFPPKQYRRNCGVTLEFLWPGCWQLGAHMTEVRSTVTSSVLNLIKNVIAAGTFTSCMYPQGLRRQCPGPPFVDCLVVTATAPSISSASLSSD